MARVMRHLVSYGQKATGSSSALDSGKRDEIGGSSTNVGSDSQHRHGAQIEDKLQNNSTTLTSCGGQVELNMGPISMLSAFGREHDVHGHELMKENSIKTARISPHNFHTLRNFAHEEILRSPSRPIAFTPAPYTPAKRARRGVVGQCADADVDENTAWFEGVSDSEETGFTPFVEQRKFEILRSGCHEGGLLDGIEQADGRSLESHPEAGNMLDFSARAAFSSKQSRVLLAGNDGEVELGNGDGIPVFSSTITLGDLDSSKILVRIAFEQQQEWSSRDVHLPLKEVEGSVALVQRIGYHRLTPLEAFWLFGKLPPEIRYMVWKFAAKHPRQIQIETDFKKCIYKPINSYTVPAVLQATSESRHVSSLILEKRFRSLDPLHGYVHFNFHLDTLCMNLDSGRRIAAIKDTTVNLKHIIHDRGSVQHLEVQFSLAWDSPAMAEAMAQLVCTGCHKAWPGLRSWAFPGKTQMGEVPFVMLQLKIKKSPTLEAGFNDIRGMARRIRKLYMEECPKLGQLHRDVGLYVSYL